MLCCLSLTGLTSRAGGEEEKFHSEMCQDCFLWILGAQDGPEDFVCSSGGGKEWEAPWRAVERGKAEPPLLFFARNVPPRALLTQLGQVSVMERDPSLKLEQKIGNWKPKEGVESPSPEIIQSHLDVFVCQLLQVALPGLGELQKSGKFWDSVS